MARVVVATLVVALVACGDNAAAPDLVPDGGFALPDAGPGARRRAVVLMIGDGMGFAQVEAASLYASGGRGNLYMQALPVAGAIRTASLSGTTDSAASATTMATGAQAYNGAIGIDRQGTSQESLVELAHARGLAAGLVTTTSLPHATPAAFSAHRSSRGLMTEIAADQALLVRPEVMLGGGSYFYSQALVDALTGDGWRLVRTADELRGARPVAGSRLFGLFAEDLMTYVWHNPPPTEPSLAEMSVAALDHLRSHDEGFFLLIEGGRIDHGGHANLLPESIMETLAFDEAVRAVDSWAAAHPDTELTLVVTADHECGGLEVGDLPAGAIGTFPPVTWRWGNHTNTSVPVYARGVRAEPFHQALRDHAFTHAVLAAAIDDAAFEPPAIVLSPDGWTDDLPHLAATQELASDSAGIAQLDALRLGADRFGLGIGVEGLFPWVDQAIVVLVDVDPGAGTGVADLGDITDSEGTADVLLAGSSLGDPGIPGFGADWAIVAVGGQDPSAEQITEGAGLRGLVGPFGSPSSLGWFGIATNFADGVRTRSTPLSPVAGAGWETFLPWGVLFGGPMPPGASVAIVVVLLDSDGGTTNQALPAFTKQPSPNAALPGTVLFTVDANGDGVGDQDAPPVIVRP